MRGQAIVEHKAGNPGPVEHFRDRHPFMRRQVTIAAARANDYGADWRSRLQKEWEKNGGCLSRFTIRLWRPITPKGKRSIQL